MADVTELFRRAVNEELEAWREAAFPNVPAFYENGPTPDEGTVGPLWIDANIRWYNAKPVTLGVRPRGRHTGTILTNVYFQAAEGTGKSDELLGAIKELLRTRHLGGGVLGMPQRTVSTDFFGWFKSGLLTPFTLDDA